MIKKIHEYSEIEHIITGKNWAANQAELFCATQAGMTYLKSRIGYYKNEELNTLIAAVPLIEPNSSFGDLCHGERARYDLFADGSLLYINNAEDEIWAFADDFCRHLIEMDPSSFWDMDRQLLAACGFADTIGGAQ